MELSQFPLWWIVSGVLFLAVWAIVGQKTPVSAISAYRFSKRRFLAEYEQRFFVQLCREVPGYFVFPRVSMTALVEPDYFRKIRATLRQMTLPRADAPASLFVTPS